MANSLTDRVSNEFITVRGLNGVQKRIPISPFGTFPLSTLESVFPGACGLEYIDSDLPTAVPFCGLTKLFSRPSTGWNNKELQVVYNDNRVSPYRMVEGNLPTSEETDKFSFYIEQNGDKLCVVAISDMLLATVQHALPTLKVEDTVNVFSTVTGASFSTKVRLILLQVDCVILKCDKKLVENGPPLALSIRRGQQITLCGRGNSCRKISQLNGNVYLENEYEDRDGTIFGPFLLGTIPISKGDSGAAVWGSEGLVGMNIGFRGFPPHTHFEAVDAAAHFSLKNIIVPAGHFDAIIKMMDFEDKVKPPFSSVSGINFC
ncbi:hypothetical protein Mgra_00006920 [Meloidogyne graminicola]|uniref:TAR DNA-binding protein 43 N-terminal domain-containing protein n=1 Tax=Meloidogyne graminicola TaxID=189291 RepID=A0A8S9ZKB8_9BILA|nr:hypothetical protein Mgra_00006920 [Meloidogyne graminicola]